MADENIARPRFKRKQFIVARRFQLKYAGVILLLMFLTAGFCSYAIYYTTMILFGEKLASVYPQGQLVSIVNTVNFRILASMLVISPLIGFLGVYLSHKIAGPIYRIEKSINNMASGDISSHITLRRGDEMVTLADAVNSLKDSLNTSMTSQKTHLENALDEIRSLKDLVESVSRQDPRIVAAFDRIESEVRLIGKEIARYKV